MTQTTTNTSLRYPFLPHPSALANYQQGVVAYSPVYSSESPSRQPEPEDGSEERSQDEHGLPEWGAVIPPSPKGPIDPDLLVSPSLINAQQKVKQLAAFSERGLSFNADLRRRKTFRNPSIAEKLFQMSQIDQLGTNFPPEVTPSVPPFPSPPTRGRQGPVRCTSRSNTFERCFQPSPFMCPVFPHI